MRQNKKNPQFRKSVDWDSINKPKSSNRVSNNHNPKNNKILEQRYRAKIELIERYNMTEDEAEKTLRDIERKVREQRKNKAEVKKVKRFIDENDDVIIPIHVQVQKQTLERPHPKPTFKSKDELINESFGKQSLKSVQEQKQMPKDSQTPNDEIAEKHMKKYEHSVKKPKENVDSVISNLISYNENDLSIEVRNISLSFEVGKDKIDNLKEYVIRSIKRNKEKRIRFQALSDISFKIYKGEKVGIIGYNGAGKSTLLNVITGIYPPDSGEVKTYGRISPLLALGAGFDHNYSGRENIYLNGAILGYDKKFLESKYDEIVEFSELGEFIDFPVKNYSSGMLAKLGFSIATIVEPDILIIDEVLGVGDVNFRKKSSDKIRSLMDKGTTVLLVSHSIPEIRKLCDKAIWIDQGRIVEIGDVNDVCNHYLKDAEKATKDQLKDIRFR